MVEKLNKNQEYEGTNEALEQAGLERSDELRAEREKSSETSRESVDEIKREALEKATSREKITEKTERIVSPAERRRDGPVKKTERAASYKRTMKQVQSEMNAPSRIFSKLVHSKFIEKTSDIVGSTIARPNAILSGAISGFVFTLAIYLFAKHYGYPLSGLESIAGFVVGWAVGLLYDYLRIEFTGRP